MMNWLTTNQLGLAGLASLATFLTLLAFTVGGIFALIRYRSDKRDAAWDRARTLYGTFLDDAFQNPEMHPFFWSTPKAKDVVLRIKYIYFIAKLLWACEEILTSPCADDTWPATMEVIMKEHVDYLCSDEFEQEKSFYYAPVRTLLEKVIGDYKLELSRA
jgi:hypothetical protein